MQSFIKIRSFFFYIIIVLLIVGSLIYAQSDTFTITILHSNDFHGANMELLAKRAAMVSKIRAESANLVLLVDAGDIFTRGPYHKRFYGSLEFDVMNQMQYDAITLGNNEFKSTDDISAQKILLERINQANFPVLCANVIDAQTGSYLAGTQPYIIKEYGEVKVAIFGITSTKTAFYRQAKGWKVTDPIRAGETIVNELAGKADIILALTHIGVNQDRILADKIVNISAIIGGDSHTVLSKPEIINNIPVVQAGDNGKYLGRLDLVFEKNGLAWKLRYINGRLIKLNNPEIIPDPDVKAIIDVYLKKPKKEAA